MSVDASQLHDGFDLLKVPAVDRTEAKAAEKSVPPSTTSRSAAVSQPTTGSRTATTGSRTATTGSRTGAVLRPVSPPSVTAATDTEQQGDRLPTKTPASPRGHLISNCVTDDADWDNTQPYMNDEAQSVQPLPVPRGRILGSSGNLRKQFHFPRFHLTTGSAIGRSAIADSAVPRTPQGHAARRPVATLASQHFVALAIGISALCTIALGVALASLRSDGEPRITHRLARSSFARVVFSELGFETEPEISDLSRDQAYNNYQAYYVADIIRATNRRARKADALADLIVRVCQELDFDPLFAAAVIKHESAFEFRARSHKGAIGLMQVMPKTGEYIASKAGYSPRAMDLGTPEHNLRLGVEYLKYLDRMYDGNRRLVLIAYNWGPANLSEALKGRLSIPSGPKKYASRILGDHARWSQHFTQVLDPDLQRDV